MLCKRQQHERKKMLITQERITQYQDFMKQRQYSDNTKQVYGYYAQRWLMQELNQYTVDSSIIKCSNNYRAFIKGFLDCFRLYNIRIIKRKGRRKQKPIDYFTKPEIDLILSTCKDTKLKLLIKLQFQIGLRISEALNLKRKNIDLVNKLIKGKGKGNKYFSLPLFEDTLKELEPLLIKLYNEDYIFQYEGIKCQRQKAWREIKHHIQDILPHKQTSEIYPHALRHSCGTYLREQGLDLREIQEALRHSTLEIVKEYTAVDAKKLANKWQEAMK